MANAITVDGKRMNVHFGQALVGHQFESLEISIEEIKKNIEIDGSERTLDYFKYVLFCRMLPGRKIVLTI